MFPQVYFNVMNCFALILETKCRFFEVVTSKNIKIFSNLACVKKSLLLFVQKLEEHIWVANMLNGEIHPSCLFLKVHEICTEIINIMKEEIRKDQPCLKFTRDTFNEKNFYTNLLVWLMTNYQGQIAFQQYHAQINAQTIKFGNLDKL